MFIGAKFVFLEKKTLLSSDTTEVQEEMVGYPSVNFFRSDPCITCLIASCLPIILPVYLERLRYCV